MNRKFLFIFAALTAFIGYPNYAVSKPDPARPNILFIIFDDWNWNHSGAYGCKWIKTPNFDRIAREGVLFKNAFTSNPKCSPCRASILTGRNTWQLEEASCHYGVFPSRFAVYPDLLEKSGYIVGLTGKGWGPGDFKAGGFTRNPAGPVFSKFECKPPATGISRNNYAGNFEDFLKQRPAGKPFCFWMGFTEPHRRYELDSGVRSGKSLSDPAIPSYLPDSDIVRGDLLDYAVEVEWGDVHIGRALKALEEAGELDRTLIVVTSDHGMPFPYVKGQITEDGFHLPLAMRWGNRIKAGRVLEDFVNVRDFAPTFLELAGLERHKQITGRSLVPLLLSAKSGWIDRSRNFMLAGKERHDLGNPYDWGYPVRAIRTTEFLYVYNFFPDRWPTGNPETDFGNCDPGPSKELVKSLGGHYYELAFGKRPAEALFDLRKDPGCVCNLASSPFFLPLKQKLHSQLFSELKREKDPRALGDGAVFDTYPSFIDRSKGYDFWVKSRSSAPHGQRPVGHQSK